MSLSGMPIDDVLHYVKAENIEIKYIRAKGLLKYKGPNDYKIIIKSDDILEDQIKTCIHEIINLHPVFLFYLKLDKSEHLSIEPLIEKLAQEAYSKRPDIVERVRKAIEEAKKLEK